MLVAPEFAQFTIALLLTNPESAIYLVLLGVVSLHYAPKGSVMIKQHSVDCRKVSYASHPGSALGIFIYTGLTSDVEDPKFLTIKQCCLSQGTGITSFNYRGHGRGKVLRKANLRICLLI